MYFVFRSHLIDEQASFINDSVADVEFDNNALAIGDGASVSSAP